jgi:hypothetical protein
MYTHTKLIERVNEVEVKRRLEVSRDHHDEIDLRELFFWIVSTIGKYKVTVFIVFVMVICLSLVVHTVKPERYTSALLFDTEYVKATELEELLASIKRYLQENNTTALRKEYGFSASVLATLEDIRLVTPKEGAVSPFKVEVTVASPVLLDRVQHELVGALRSYAERVAEIERNAIRQNISLLRNEIETVEGMIEVYHTSDRSLSRHRETLPDLLRLKVQLEKELLELKKHETMAGQIRVIQDFAVFKTPVNKDLRITLGVGLLVFLTISSLIIGVCESAQWIKKRRHTVYEEPVVVERKLFSAER